MKCLSLMVKGDRAALGCIGRIRVGQILLLLLLPFACASREEAQFTAIVNTPPTPTVTYVLANTQVNVYDGGNVAANVSLSNESWQNSKVELNVYGGVVGRFLNARRGSTTNIFGGKVQGGFTANNGAVVNLAGGILESITVNIDSVLNITGGTLSGSATVKSGGKFTVTGGTLGGGFHADPGSIVSISGGMLGDNVWLESGNTTISGGTFGNNARFLASSPINLTGASFGTGFYGRGTLNMSAGSIGSSASFQYGTLNLSGGKIDQWFTANSGATINMTGGSFGSFTGQQGSTLNMSGGVLGTSVYTSAGSSVTLAGGEFKLDGIPIAGLDTIGNTIPFNLPTGSLLSGVMADGTPFAYSSLDGDRFLDGTLKLKRAAVTAVVPGVIDLNHDPAPLGIRGEQTLIVPASSSLVDNFIAGEGSSVVISGGQVARNLEAVGAHVNITGGSVGRWLDAFRGSTIDIAGGVVGEAMDAFAGSVVNVSGGQIAEEFRVYSGGTLNLSGGWIGDRFTAESGSAIVISGAEFRLDGQLVPGLDAAGSTAPINIPAGSVLSGTLADGLPFAFSDLERDAIADGTMTLKSTAVPVANLATFHVPNDPAPASIRGGQTLIVADGGAIDPRFSAGWGSHVQITGGTIGEDFEANGAEIAVSGGTVVEMAIWNSHLDVSGGTIGVGYSNDLRAGNNSVVNVSGGTFSQDVIIDHSTIDFSGGEIRSLFVRNHGVANITGGVADVNCLDHSIVNITGGIASDAHAIDGVINLSGSGVVDEFSIGQGGVANISGGTINYDLYAGAGSRANISGGNLGTSSRAVSGAVMNISGGTFGDRFGALTGSQVRFLGSDFRIDEAPISGLELVGSTQAIDLPAGSLLTGTLSDGTPFALSSDDFDAIDNGTVTLEATPVVAGPAAIQVPNDAAPRGVHNGQSLTLNTGGKLPNNFNAGRGSSVTITGGEVGNNFEAAGANVDIQGGTIGSDLDAFAGSVVNVTGGSVGGSLNVFRGGVVNVAGGAVAGYATALNGGKLNISAGVVNGPINSKAGGEVNISGGSVLSTGIAVYADHGRVNISGGGVGAIAAYQDGEVNLSGGTVTQPITLNSISVLNVSGGEAAGGLKLYSGSTANVSGGALGSYVSVGDGGTLNVSGGVLAKELNNNGTTNISGGAFGRLVNEAPLLTLSGNDFRLNGLPVAGLDHIGSAVSLIPGYSATLTGTLADGTPFVFSTQDGDRFGYGPVELRATALPSIGPSQIHLPSDQAPLGIRSGQTMYVASDGSVPDNFNAGVGSKVVIVGGHIGRNFEAIGANIEISGGNIDDDFFACQGSTVDITGGHFANSLRIAGSTANISGGTFDEHLWFLTNTIANFSAGTANDGVLVDAGAVLNISGGVVTGAIGLNPSGAVSMVGGALRGGLNAYSGSHVTLTGNDFRLDNVPIAGLETIGNFIDLNLATSSELTGTLADGTPIALNTLNLRPGLVTLRAAAIADGPNLIELPRDAVPLGIHNGQTLVVGDGASLPLQFVAGPGSTLELRGGSLDCEFLAAGATINVHAGIVGDRLQAWTGTVLNVTGGIVGDGLTAYGTSVVNISGGKVGSGFHATHQSVVNISGGSVGVGFRADYDSTVNITGGSIGRSFFAADGSKVNLAGGTIGDGFGVSSHSELTISGNEFRIDGVLVDLSDFADEPRLIYLWEYSLLSGTLADGSTFAFGIADTDGLAGSFYDYKSVRLKVVSPPAATPTHYDASTGPVPSSIRAGQSMTAHDGGTLPENFSAGWGSNVAITGGEVGGNFEATGARVTITGGQIGNEFDAFVGSVVDISGGMFGEHFSAHDKSVVNISGGTFARGFEALPGSTVNLFATKLWLNDVPIDGLTMGVPYLLSRREGDFLTGLWANGSQFKFQLTTYGYSEFSVFSSTATLNLVLVAVPEPAGCTLALCAGAMALFPVLAGRRKRSTWAGDDGW